ncbi:MAG TPA: hypothetical protein VMI94_03990 [Bryobacteraceae bacterium]|nr:hypothetical protein [Bryobacteraceae bacterium]
MIQPVYSNCLEAMRHARMPGAPPAPSESDFNNVLGSVAETDPAAAAATAPASTNTSSEPSAADSTPTLGDPNIEGFLGSYYERPAQGTAEASAAAASAEISYQPADGAPTIYSPDWAYGPDQIYMQALANQAGNAFAEHTGMDPALVTAQLPGIPTVQAQQQFDGWLALNNAQRLASGQPIDTAAYWSDPGPVTYKGVTYTSAQLGYCGPGQSSGPEPIFISRANQVGPDTYTVPGYQGTVKGIQPERYYSLQQLQQAGLQTGQPDTQYYPGSWSLSTNA